jgi:hypothetical protein
MKTARITKIKDFVEGGLYNINVEECDVNFNPPIEKIDQLTLMFIGTKQYYEQDIEDGFLLNFYCLNKLAIVDIHSDHIDTGDIIIYKI